jgi:hypothetical protein
MSRGAVHGKKQNKKHGQEKKNTKLDAINLAELGKDFTKIFFCSAPRARDIGNLNEDGVAH